jgi:hypothetical protein
VQGQDYRWAKWSIGLRTDGCTDDEVERVIQNGRLVRTWMFRGTLHFVAADDLTWLTSLLAPGMIKRNARRYRQLALDDVTFSRSQQVIRLALAGNGPLTRSEIKAHLEEEGIPAEGQQVPYLLQRAALDGLICHGPQRGSKPTYLLLAEWIGEQRALNRPEALGALASRYLMSHGPATRHDFAWWSGLSTREARLALDLAPEAVSMEVDDVQYWAIGEPPPASETEIACLLPPFDEYLLGFKDRALVLDPAYTKRVNAGGGMLKPTVMVNGEIVGIWSYKAKDREVTVSIQPFRDLASHERDLIDQAAGRFGRFRSGAVDVRY